MKCSKFLCDRRVRDGLSLCDACLSWALYGPPPTPPDPRPVWVQRALARRLPAKDYSSAA
jgi:hypothetical protein